jgi:hypothetical protein
MVLVPRRCGFVARDTWLRRRADLTDDRLRSAQNRRPPSVASRVHEQVQQPGQLPGPTNTGWTDLPKQPAQWTGADALDARSRSPKR